MRRLRTEKTGIVFDSIARGWAFDVTEHFRPSLDIAYTRRLDKEKNAERRRQLGRELKESEKIYKCVWTRGEPAAYSFLEGQIFYDPPGIRSMIGEDALKRVARMVQIKEATPDPGARGVVRDR